MKRKEKHLSNVNNILYGGNVDYALVFFLWNKHRRTSVVQKYVQMCARWMHTQKNEMQAKRRKQNYTEK